MSIWVTGSLEVRDSTDKVVFRVGDSSATEGGGVVEAKMLTASDPTGLGGLMIVRDDSSISTNDSLGAIQFGGNDPSAFQPGFMAIAEAAGNWASNYVQATTVRFYTQDSSSGVNKIGVPEHAVLMISGANSNTTEFGVPLNVAGATHTKKTLQVGVSQNGGADPVNTSTGYIFRVSNDDGPNAGIEVDSDGSGVSSIFFNRDGQNTSGGFGMGIFVDHGSTQNRFSIRKYATDQTEGAIVIHDNGNSVRVGGGARRDTYDDGASLVVTASAGDRNPHVLIRSRFATRDTANQPTLTLDYDDTATGTQNGGTWHFTVGSEWARNSTYRPVIIGSTGVANSNFSRSPAITIAEGGDTASVGIGGSDTGFTRSTAGGIYPRSMNPTGSLHVENENSAEIELETSLDKTTLLLGNSDDSTGRQFAELSFDVARDYDPGKRTAAITVVRSGSTLSSEHKGNMHFRLYDGSGNSNSTRTRMRIDDQGAMLIFSGTHAVQGAGYPDVRDNNLLVGQDVPSGSLTLIAQGGSTNSKPEIQPTLNFMLYTGTDDNDASRAVSLGDSLGRIAWWSNDNNLTAQNERVAAYIEATAATDHDASNKATADLSFYTRRNSEPDPTPLMVLTSQGTVDLTAPSGVNVIGDATFSGKIQKTGDLTVDVSGDIALSADGDQITMDDGSATRFTFQLDSSPEIDVDGDFKLDGSGTVDIVSVGDMTLDSTTDIILSADGNNIKMDDGTTTRFDFNVAANGGLTIGASAAEDCKIIFNSNSNDYYAGYDATDDRMKLGRGLSVGTNAAAQVGLIGGTTTFLANSYDQIQFVTTITPSDTTGAGTKRAFSPGIVHSGIDFRDDGGATDTGTSVSTLMDYIWIAPCDGSFVAASFNTEYRLRSSGANNSSNTDTVRINMYKQSGNVDTDDATQWTSGGTQMQFTSSNYSATYYGIFRASGSTHMTKRTGVFNTFGFAINPSSNYETSDGSADIDGTWEFSRGDKIIFSVVYNAYGDGTDVFYDDKTDNYVSLTNTLRMTMVVRYDWSSDGSF